MITRQDLLNEALVKLFHDKQMEFYHEAMNTWDNGEVSGWAFGDFIRVYVFTKWVELYKRN